MTKKIFIAGLGLIGGSLALAVKAGHPKAEIIGFDLNEKAMKLASSLQIIDHAADSLAGAEEADFIIIAAPVESSLTVMDELAGLSLKEGAVITDVGSTKQSVVEKACVFAGSGAIFIGGHPMAGSHKSGVEASRERLFENAFYVLTPGPDVTDSMLIKLQNLLRGTKAKFLRLEAADHDRYAGLISHLPHIIASALVHEVEEAGKEEPLVQQLAAGGFRDITRIASASPTMWRDILVHNKETLLPMLESWKNRLHGIEQLLREDDSEGIYAFFERAKSSRDKLPSRQKGAMLPFYDLFVDIPDHPGVISDVTGLLAVQNISITNIRIIEAREGIMGVLRLSFRSESDLIYAKQVLEEHMYETYEAP
ncbi:prephenate dehydrogenase [Alkalicoccus luteus]|uniref:Prephenate dehydrogenase n=1 Tax=Alkalicoccus luteus TaxID=1237094 RepID=A0A969TXF8_9BACI|nr:prephenate dehydrogenase [Alkalicoccus luteus]NJP38199.1 prephenate dehydrogenase [Alkalicoccus luteus]